MIILDSTAKSLVAVLAGAVSANQPIYTVAYADTDGTTFTEGSADGTFNSATPITLLAAPASGHRRIIKSISIYNADTASVTYSLYLLNTAAVQIIEKRTLTTLASKLYGFEALDPFNQGLNTGDSPTFTNLTDNGLTASSVVLTNASKKLVSGGIATNATLPAFLAIQGAVSNVTGDGTGYQPIFGSAIFDQASNFNNGTGVFTAPATGIYNFSVRLYINGLLITHTSGDIELVTTGRTLIPWLGNPYAVDNGSGGTIQGGDCLLSMNSGNTAHIVLYVYGGTLTVGLAATYGYFSGFMVC